MTLLYYIMNCSYTNWYVKVEKACVTWCHVLVNTGVNSPWMLYITDGVDVFDGGVYLIKCLPETTAGTGTSITK